MRAFITGEKGFIARNLINRSQLFDNIDFITSQHQTYQDVVFHREGEPCVYQNDLYQWAEFFRNNQIDVVIHNAATVGTDVVALDPRASTLTNVEGTYNICRAAKRCGIPVCYMGTTVIYDTKRYQDSMIKENSKRAPHTLYGCHKLCGEDIVKSQVSKWMVIRPLFAYGGEGDMNSLIAKTIYGSLNEKTSIDMFCFIGSK